MRQVWMNRKGEADVMEVREVGLPDPRAGQVRIRVAAAGVNFADVMMRRGLYPDAPKLPAVAGYEVAGEVDGIGPDVEEDLLGAAVVAMCSFGGYSESICLPRAQVWRLPAGVSPVQAAALPVNYLTAWQMVRVMAPVGEGDLVLVHSAAGGVGQAVVQLCRLAVELIDRDIEANRRDDGLYHTYNLPEFTSNGAGVEVERLQQMLEGQVAVLSAGVLTPAQSLAVLDALFASDLYCERRRSFMLYPERQLPGFMQRNVIPVGSAEAVPLLEAMLKEDDGRVVARDADGVVRFQGDLANGADLALVLEDLGRDPRWKVAVRRDSAKVLALFEEVFDHDSYTGRSGVMYAYEGLGCIYWHMVAKLLLAVQENVLRAEAEGVAPEIQQRLAAMYMKVRAGIGYEKTAAEYGAFPMDPYSHTPPVGGAKQPGMTGQVKEEILTRLGELGVRVEAGALRFQPDLLCPSEFLAEPAEFGYFDLEGGEQALALKPGSLAFTYCQVPVEYRRVEGKAWIKVAYADGTDVEFAGSVLEESVASEIHGRTGRVTKITAGVPGHTLCPEAKN